MLVKQAEIQRVLVWGLASVVLTGSPGDAYWRKPALQSADKARPSSVCARHDGAVKDERCHQCDTCREAWELGGLAGLLRPENGLCCTPLPSVSSLVYRGL